LRLVTFLPELLRKVPSLRSRIAVATFFCALGPYFFAMTSSLGARLQVRGQEDSPNPADIDMATRAGWEGACKSALARGNA
jgi:hypothetical protein